MPPPQTVFDSVGIDLRAKAEEARREMWIQKHPDPLVGETPISDPVYHSQRDLLKSGLYKVRNKSR